MTFYIISLHLRCQKHTDIDDLSQSIWISRDTMLGEKTISGFLGVLGKLFNLGIRGEEGASTGHLKFLHACLTIGLA